LQAVAAELGRVLDRNAAGALESMDPAVADQEELDVLRGDQLEGIAAEALDSLALNGFDAPLDADQELALEAIVLPQFRPVVNIVNNTFAPPPAPWGHLAGLVPKRRIDQAIRSVARIEIPRHPRLIPYAGTGFIVGKLPQFGVDGHSRHLMM